MNFFYINKTMVMETPFELLLFKDDISITCSCGHSWEEVCDSSRDKYKIKCNNCAKSMLISVSKVEDKIKGSTNPYYDTFKLVDNDNINSFSYRDVLVRKYSFAIPDERALTLIDKYSPIVEIGAGSGYWTKMLRDRKVDVLAYDKSDLSDNKYKFKGCYTEVLKGDTSVLNHMDERTLLMIWPCYATSFAHDSITSFSGDTLIYIGESYGGCTGDDDFFDELGENWGLVEEYEIPRWNGLHDYLMVYKRK